MAKPTPLFQDATGFAKDYPRDQMPQGYMWDLVDYVPTLLDAQLTNRGGWKWASAVNVSDFVGGIYAPFASGDRLLVVGSSGNLHEVNLMTQALTTVGAVGHIVQNPVMHRDQVYVANSDGNACTQVKLAGTTYTLTPLPATAPKARYAAVYKDRLLLGNDPTNPQRVTFSPAGDPMATLAVGGVPAGQWDPNTYFNTSLPLTGLGALRATILLFHSGSVERLRGGIPPTTADPLGDMFLEPLYDRAGCGDARSIAYWQDNCIFADERGVHFTDGATIRNLAAQGGILTFWRTLWLNRATVCADTYLDYYLITVIRTDGIGITLVCDLQRRTWFRFSNIKAQAYIHSIGAQAQLWGCRQGSQRLTALSTCFFPLVDANPEIDDDGTAVLPVIETGWSRFGEEARKRMRFIYTSYDCRMTGITPYESMRSVGDEVVEADVLDSRRELGAVTQNEAATLALSQALEVGYITMPSQPSYVIAGNLPETQGYSRYRLPIGKHPYGMAFRIRQVSPSYVTRLYGLSIQASMDERSRL